MTATDAQETQEATDAPEKGGRSTHFDFENKVFAIPGAYFTLVRDRDEPTYFVPMGDVTAALNFRTLRESFGIPADSHDGQLLLVVERGVRYVKQIRPNDSIPRELLDGTASWSYDERHYAIAQGRLSLQLIGWITGEKPTQFDAAALERLVTDPENKQRIQQAFTEIAEHLGLGRDRRQEVADRVEALAREASYVEALREYYGHVRQIFARLNHLAKHYRRDPRIAEDVQRMMTLMRPPLRQYETAFQEVDARLADVVRMLKTLDGTIHFIRDVRDELHFRLSDWQELIEKWRVHPVQPTEEDKNATEQLLKQTYHFLAKRFQVVQAWARTT